MFIAVAALAAAALAAPAQSSALPATLTLAELGKRHHHAMGDIPAATVRWSGSESAGGIARQFTVIADSSGRYRGSWQSALGTTVAGSDGTSDWTEDEAGAVETQPSRHAFELGYELIRLNAYHFEGQKATVSGPSTIDGDNVYLVKVDDASNPLTLYIDAKTFLVDGVDTSDSVIRYKTYKRFDGFPVPTLIVDTTGGQTNTRVVDDVAFGINTTAGTFAAPSAREPSFPTGVTDVTLAFDDPHSLVLIPATINGKTVHLLLDSGSSTSVLDASVAKQLGLPTAGVAKIEGANMLTGTFARADTLDVAGITFTPFIFESVPLDLPSALAHDGVDGVLGYTFLEHVVARIAYFPRQLQLIQPSAFTYGGTGAVMPADLSDRIPLISAPLDQGDTATFTIDTGSDQGIVLFDSYANAHHKAFVDPIDLPPTSAGAGGDVRARSVVVKQVNFGKFEVDNVPAEVVLQATGAFVTGVSDGLVGASVLSAFRDVFLDYKGRRVIFER